MEAFRVLKPGGRLMVSDIVLLKELPDFVRDSVKAYIGCLSGAMLKDKYLDAIKYGGFKEVEIQEETTFSLDCIFSEKDNDAILKGIDLPPEKIKEIESSILSIRVSAYNR